MLTVRGWWLLIITLAMLLVAMLNEFVNIGLSSFSQSLSLHQPDASRGPNVTLALVALPLGGWFVWEWLSFAIRARLVIRRLYCHRELRDERGPVDTLWAGQTFRVRVELSLPAGLGLPYLILEDRLPFGV